MVVIVGGHMATTIAMPLLLTGGDFPLLLLIFLQQKKEVGKERGQHTSNILFFIIFLCSPKGRATIIHKKKEKERG
jgi:hypothetical protein